MMNRAKIGTGWRAGRTAALFGVLGLLAGVSACGDSGVDPEQTIETAGETSDVVGGLTGEAGLGDVPGLREIIREYEGRLGEPGMAWYLAADLQAVLTSDQIAVIAAFQEELGRRVRDRMSEGFGHGMGLGRVIDLTEEQRAAIGALREQYRPEFEAIREAIAAGTLDREGAREQIKSIREALHAELEAILTDEQKAALDKLKAGIEGRRAEFDDRREEREVAGEAERAAMRDALGLTAEQIAAIEALRGDWTADGDVSREERRAAHEAAMEQILTEAQQEIVVLQRAVSSRLRIRRMGVGVRDGAGFGPRRGGFGPRGGVAPDGSGRSGG